MTRSHFAFATVAVLLLSVGASAAPPPDFVDEIVAGGFVEPIAVGFLPDGRILVVERDGDIYIADPNANPVVPTAYMTVPDVDFSDEHGLFDITLDPNFEINGYFYVYYTDSVSNRHRIARFTHQGTFANPASEFVVWQDNELVTGVGHIGGGLDFGPDGLLYLTTGDEGDGPQAQDLTRSGGKVIRVHSNGDVPLDNPHVDGAGPLDDYVYARGLRNPLRSRWDLVGGRFFIADVGQDTLEEIHVGAYDGNFGWADCEGICGNPYDDPIATHPHNVAGGSITGGYVNHNSGFPDAFSGVYFFADFVQGWIRYLEFDGSGNVVASHDFDPDIGAYSIVFLDGAPDGSMYYIEYFTGNVRRVSYTRTPLYSDDFDRAVLGSNWAVDNGSFGVASNTLVENSGSKFTTAQMRWLGGVTSSPDQYAKLEIIDPVTHTFGFMFRAGDPSGMHYEVHLPRGSAQWRWELNDPGFVNRVGDCVGDQPPSDGDWLGAQVEGSGASTVVSVWRWDSNPDDDPAGWGAPDCQMSQDPSTAVDAGLELGIRSYTGNSTLIEFADNWSAGDLGPPGVCGNGIIETGEQCDDSGESPTCDADCSFATCGDGTFNPSAEACETDGDCSAGDVCDLSCACVIAPVCGDGVVEFGEECDDSGESSFCDTDCTFSMCGDLNLNPSAGEVCETDGDCSAGDTCQSCACVTVTAQSFADDFNRVGLGPNWTIDSGSFGIVSNTLVENSASKFVTAQMRWLGGETDTADQYAKIQIISPATHTFGFMFRTGDPSGMHYEVHVPLGTAEWRWELNDPGFVGRVGDCVGDQSLSDGDWIGAQVEGAAASTLVSVWRWDTDPDSDPAGWGPPDCQMAQIPATSVDLGRGLGLRSYTGNSTNGEFADNWSAGDLSAPGTCGNGILEPGEQCDDSGASATCDADCSFATCGDGTYNPLAEVCETDGECMASEFCTLACECELAPVCGDGVTDAFESCDDSGASATCDADCSFAACGDGIFNPLAEACEIDADCSVGESCDGLCACVPDPICGNGITELGEDCDDSGASATCDADCSFATCGDGNYNPAAEQCEFDANCSGGEICDNGCACIPAPVCGNGVTELGEDCDDFGESGSCDADCTFAICGDLTLNPSAGESCEVDTDCPVDESCQSCGCFVSNLEAYADDFDRAALGSNWAVDSGSFAIASNALVENSGSKFLTAQMRWVGGETDAPDQFAKLQIVDPAKHTFGFMFRVGDPSGMHYEVHLPLGGAEWRWELGNPGFAGRVDDCVGDLATSNGDWIGARIDGAGASTVIGVWRWNTDPGDDPATWGAPDCHMTEDPATPADLGRGLGIRTYTGNLTASGEVDNWNAGDVTVPPVPPAIEAVTRILGHEGAGPTQLVTDPDGVATDSAGNVYVGACGFGANDQGVFKITPALQITRIMGRTGDGTNIADCMVGVDVDPAGNVYAAAYLSNNVFKITPAGTVSQIMDSSGAGTPNTLLGPLSVVVDSVGNVYASADTSDRVFKRTPGGTVTQVLGPEGDNAGTILSRPFGIAIDSLDNLYVPGLGLGSDAVFQVTPGGTVSVVLDSSGDGLGQTLEGPHAVTVDSNDNVFVTGNLSDNVFKITPSGTISVILDATGNGQGQTMQNPTGITTDTSGNVFVNSFFSNNVFKVTPAGAVTQILDSNGDGQNAFINPADVGITTDAAGNVFTAGTSADNVFKIEPTP